MQFQKQSEKEVPIWEKKCLSVEEAAVYSGVGRNKLRELIKKKNCPFVLPLGNQIYIVREKLDKFLEKEKSI